MANSVFPESWTYAGTDITTSDFRITLQLIEGNGPMDVRGSDTVIPHKAGRTVRNRTNDRLTITLEGFIAGQGDDFDEQVADMADLYEDIRSLFRRDQQPQNLVSTRPNGNIWTIACRPVDLMWGPPEHPLWRSLSVQFEAVSDWDYS